MSGTSPLRIEHILQPAILCRDLDRTMDLLHAMLGIYPSERVSIPYAGVRNAVYAFNDMTFLELIEPYDEKSSAARLLERNGEGWHMLSVDLVDASPDEVDRRLAELNVHVVHKSSSEHVKAEWHLHPRDAGGVLLLLALRNNHDESGAYAGWRWREYVATNTRRVHSILGVSAVTDRLQEAAERYRVLGFEFGEQVSEDSGDAVLQANCPRGTFFQLRSPSGESSPSAQTLASRGRGLFHLAFGVKDPDAALVSIEKAGGQIERRIDGDGLHSFWTDPATTLGVTMEFRVVS